MGQRPLPMIRGGYSDLTQSRAKPAATAKIAGGDLETVAEQELTVVWRGPARVAVIEEAGAGELYVHLVGGPCERVRSYASAYDLIERTPVRQYQCAFCSKPLVADFLRAHVEAEHPEALAAAQRGEGRRFVQTVDAAGQKETRVYRPGEAPPADDALRAEDLEVLNLGVLRGRYDLSSKSQVVEREPEGEDEAPFVFPAKPSAEKN